MEEHRVCRRGGGGGGGGGGFGDGDDNNDNVIILSRVLTVFIFQRENNSRYGRIRQRPLQAHDAAQHTDGISVVDGAVRHSPGAETEG